LCEIHTPECRLLGFFNVSFASCGCIWNEELNQKAKYSTNHILLNKYISYFGKQISIPIPPTTTTLIHTHTLVGGGWEDKIKYTVHGSVCCDHTKGLYNSVSSLNNWYFIESASTRSLLPSVNSSSSSWYQKFYLLHKFMIMAVFISFSFTCS